MHVMLQSPDSCCAGTQEDTEQGFRESQIKVLDQALQLSRQRQAAVPFLKMAVEACLADLAMPGSCFDIQLAWEPAHEVRVNLVPVFPWLCL